MNDDVDEITVADFEKHLQIDKNALDEQLEMHPVILYDVSSALARAMDIRDAAKKLMEEGYAKISINYRTDGLPSGAKQTEESIKQEVLATAEYRELVDVYLEAKSECDQWYAMKDAMTARGIAMRTLAELYVANYFADVTVKGSSVDRVTAEIARDKLTTQRKKKEEDRLKQVRDLK